MCITMFESESFPPVRTHTRELVSALNRITRHIIKPFNRINTLLLNYSK